MATGRDNPTNKDIIRRVLEVTGPSGHGSVEQIAALRFDIGRYSPDLSGYPTPEATLRIHLSRVALTNMLDRGRDYTPPATEAQVLQTIGPMVSRMRLVLPEAGIFVNLGDPKTNAEPVVAMPQRIVLDPDDLTRVRWEAGRGGGMLTYARLFRATMNAEPDASLGDFGPMVVGVRAVSAYLGSIRQQNKVDVGKYRGVVEAAEGQGIISAIAVGDIMPPRVLYDLS